MSASSPNPVRVAIVGATGYAGIELVRLLHNHPGAEITLLGSRSSAGKPMSDVFGHLDIATGAATLEEFDVERHADAADVFFLAQDNGQAMKTVPALLERGRRVIDLSGDFRFRNHQEYEAWYGITHTAPDLLMEAVYGLPEVHGSRIRGAHLVANPGCYTTTAILALAPALACNAVEPTNIVVDALSGVSGAGRAKKSTDFMFSELNENAKAYGIGRHRHTPEIEQELGIVCGGVVCVTFTPHLVPITRGILATCYAGLRRKEPLESLHRFYTEFYADAPFVDVLPLGQYPSLQSVRGSNRCVLGLAADGRTDRFIVVSATDNLLKGASGQAVQNFNIMTGFPETTNLPRIALYP